MIVALALLILGGTSHVSYAQSRLTVALKDGQNAAVVGAVVMMQPNAGTPLQARPLAREVQIDQIDREFVPRVSIAAVGARVSFPNRDVVQHSVYSFSKIKTFEIPIYAGESPQTIVLDKPGVISLGCNIHDWMVGYIVVVDAPIAEVTKADGVATIADLPRGTYTVRIWHPQLKGGEMTQTVSMNQEAVRLEVVLDTAPARVRYKPPLSIKRY
jgi:plastocyanin